MSYATRAELAAKLPTGVHVEDLSDILDQVEDAIDSRCGNARPPHPHVVTEVFRRAVWRAVERLANNEPITSTFDSECVEEIGYLTT